MGRWLLGWTVLAAVTLEPPAVAQVPDSVSPDGRHRYTCGVERQSVGGCFNAWTKLTHDGDFQGWVPAYCRDQSDAYSQGRCDQGGVAWWWWHGSGRIGDPVLKDFWFRDYAGPEVNGVVQNDHPYGDARRLPGSLNCYGAKGSIFCMQFMQPPVSTIRP